MRTLTIVFGYILLLTCACAQTDWKENPFRYEARGGNPLVSYNNHSNYRYILFENECNNSSDWIITDLYGSSGFNWSQNISVPNGLFSSAMGPIQSYSYQNGILISDPDFASSNLFDVAIELDQDIWTPSTGGSIRFLSYYRKRQGDQVFLEVSSDNFSTYDQFELYTNFSQGDISPNPDVIVVDLTTSIAAAGGNPLRIRFRHKGTTNGYAWMIDDIEITYSFGFDGGIGRDIDAKGIKVHTAYMNSYLHSQYLNFTRIPIAHRTDYFLETEIENNGVNNMTGIGNVFHARLGDPGVFGANFPVSYSVSPLLEVGQERRDSSDFFQLNLSAPDSLFVYSIIDYDDISNDEYQMDNSSDTVGLYITLNEYSTDHGEFSDYGYMLGMDLGTFYPYWLANGFPFFADDTVTSVKVAFHPSTQAGFTAFPIVYEIDTAAATFQNMFVEVYNGNMTGNTYSVSSSDISTIGNIVWRDLPLSQPAPVEAGKFYAIGIGVNATDTVRIMTDDSNPADLSTFMYDETGYELGTSQWFWVDVNPYLRATLGSGCPNSAPDSTSICFVTTDHSLNQNFIVWEKPVSTEIEGFNIYRELTPGLDTLLGFWPYDSLSVFYDTYSNPQASAYSYQIRTVNVCGLESDTSLAHSSIHLNVNNMGATSALSWTSYIGANAVKYRIYRDTIGSGVFELYDSIPGGMSTNYTDLNPPTGTAWYYVEADLGFSCAPTRALIDAKIKSPIFEQSMNTDIKELGTNAKIFPNPVTEILIIEGEGIQGSVLEIYNVLGERVKSESIVQDVHRIEVSGLPKGSYVLRLIFEKDHFTTCFVKE